MKRLFQFLLLASLTGPVAVQAQTGRTDDGFADPAFRSPVVAVEFTGQRCRYCPNLSRALKEHENHYGSENYIITALHSLEEYSLLPGRHVSLFNKEAQEYAASIEVHSGLPQLVYNTLGPKVSDLELTDKFLEDDLLECTGQVHSADGKQLTIDIRTRLRRNQQKVIEGKQIDILFWALENDIVALQDDNGKFIYPAHQHIFRGSINGTWGESYTIGSTYRKTFAVPAAVSEIKNTEVVVFFLDHESRTVLDAGRFKVGNQPATAIDDVLVTDPQAPQTLYDLQGRPVTHPVSGNVYIRNGRKVIAD